MTSIKAVVSVIGRDQKGAVARFATYLAQHGVNIEDILQQVVHGHFIMDMLVDLADLTIRLDELIPGLLDVGREINMEVRVALHHEGREKKIAVLASKEPGCLQKLINDQATGCFDGRGKIVCVLANHPDQQLTADRAGIPFHWMTSTDKAAHMKWVQATLTEYQADLVVLARYMQILPAEVVAPFRHRIINIHPSLLPHFPGATPYKQAFNSGLRVTGCTAHFVTEDLDEGPIILQDVFHIDVGKDTLADVMAKGQALEASVLSQATQMYMDEKLVVVDDKVVFRPGLSSFLDRQ